MNKLLLIVVAVLMSCAVFAKEDSPQAATNPAKASGKKQKVTVSFGDDELINGSNPAPEVEFIFEKANFNYKKLIRLRENFIPEADGGREGFGARE